MTLVVCISHMQTLTPFCSTYSTNIMVAQLSPVLESVLSITTHAQSNMCRFQDQVGYAPNICMSHMAILPLTCLLMKIDKKKGPINLNWTKTRFGTLEVKIMSYCYYLQPRTVNFQSSCVIIYLS